MSADMLHLLKSRRFGPLFLTQFLGAANDNVFKSALVMLITFKLADQAGLDGPVLVTLAAGIFIAPFVLFSATAGQLADCLDKAFLARVVKGAEILIMGAAAFAFMNANAYALMTVLFLMGAQSAVFGPVKYAILPQHLHPDELISANAMVEAGTFLAILLGTVAGGLLILREGGVEVVSALIVSIAVLGFGSSLFIPKAPALDVNLRINFNIVVETYVMVRHAAAQREVLLSILGISWFWLVGATFLSQFPTFAKNVLGGDENVVTFLLGIFSVGIGLGSALCAKIVKGKVTAKYVPFAALSMSVFMVDLYFASSQTVFAPGTGLGVLLRDLAGLRVVIDLLMIAISGGLFIVPLYAILQTRGDAMHRARDIAVNNIYNALFMVGSALVVSALLTGGMTVPGVFLTVAIANGGVALFIFKSALMRR